MITGSHAVYRGLQMHINNSDAVCSVAGWRVHLVSAECSSLPLQIVSSAILNSKPDSVTGTVISKTRVLSNKHNSA